MSFAYFLKIPFLRTPLVTASVYIFLRQSLSVYKISTVHCKVFICGRDTRHHLFESGVFDRKFDKERSEKLCYNDVINSCLICPLLKEISKSHIPRIAKIIIQELIF